MSCQLCQGNKWVFVLDGYVDKQAPVPTRVEAQDPAEFAALLAENTAKRAALANTTYPCRDCAPAAFFRWAGGHLDPGHERGDCEDCRRSTSPRHGGHGQRRRGVDQPPLLDAPGYVLTDDPPQDWTQTRKDLE